MAPSNQRLLPMGIACLVLGVAAPSRAERTVANDTLAESTPAAVSCGFCVGERYGSILRVTPSDLPFDVQSVLVALGAARVAGVAGSRCEAIATEPLPRTGRVEIWVGAAEEPSPQPGGPDERLLWSSDDAPLVPSLAVEGTEEFEVSFNEIVVEDAERVTDARYLRIVVDIPRPAELVESQCSRNDWGPDPDAFPMRDDDGIMEHVNSVLSVGGAGLGWVWSEELGVNGDWGVRAVIQTRAAPPMDAGVGDAGIRDAGPRADSAAAPRDAGRRRGDMGSTADAGGDAGGAGRSGPSGGACSVGGTTESSAVWWLLGAAILARARRRLRG
ncbi:MAG: hypothetical protein IT379_25105 [Deltaproteobacteria bacterium]|nr:hypothetical protein [Deltaproteobacteria bacterium]